jgi:hypothetical protein
MNPKTGKLNLKSFMGELDKSKMSISEYGKSLANLGPEGVKAFNQVTSAIIESDKATRTISKGMEKLGNTLMNTVRW